MERIKELEQILAPVCEEHWQDCSKCPKQAECEEYARLEENQR